MSNVQNQSFSYVLDGTAFSYTGQVDRDGNPHGKGEATWDDGRTYKGEFSHGALQGQGTFEDKNNHYKFEGTMKANSFENGRMTYTDDGSYFDGTFKDGDAYDGTFTDASGNKSRVKNGKYS